MATTPATDNARLPDPAKLGADQSPETSRADDSQDMSPVLAEQDKDQSPDTSPKTSGAALGSDFERQRARSAGHNDTPDAGQGMGRAGYNGDEDRGYDQSTYRGGLGGSGGREDHAATAADTNPFTGGYDGGGTDQPSPEQTKNLGLNTPQPE